MSAPRLLLIDNYDSLTYNLVQAFMVLGAEVIVHRNDQITIDEAKALEPTHLCISPGPGTPHEAGVSMNMIEAFAGELPIFGVCLGHQSLVEVFGGKVVRAPRLMHGKTSLVHHDGKTILEHMPAPFEAGRYHSLIAQPDSMPRELEVSARTSEGEIMGVRHTKYMIEGVQFHPESVLTPQGPQLMGDFLKLSSGTR
jgi:anthranilate synthase/aminodeoxychorismate synthase-like glutamine amidotransferase